MLSAVVCSGRKRPPLFEEPVGCDGQRSAFVALGRRPNSLPSV